MEWQKRITVNQNVVVGKPVIKGTRITVDFLLELLAHNWTKESILNNYPQLQEEDILAALEYSAQVLKLETIQLIE